jgi:uncharacterized protein YdcH (DUF465 family)
MSYHKRIDSLNEAHRLLDKQIIELEKVNGDSQKISELKKQKLQYKDEITRLTKLQWEEDHERVHFEDDR